MKNLTDKQLNAISVMVHEGRLCVPMNVSDREFHSWLASADFKEVLLNNMFIAKLVKLMNSDDEAVALKACSFIHEHYLDMSIDSVSITGEFNTKTQCYDSLETLPSRVAGDVTQR